MKVLKIANKIQKIETELICFGSNSKLENEQRKLANKLAKKVKTGSKWQAERMYSKEDMQEYAEFCIICNQNTLPCITAKDWFEQFKNK